MISPHPIAAIFGILLGALSLAAGLIWFERRLLALFQDRYGPNRVGPFGLLQVLADMIKIFAKEDWVPPFADRTVFVLAPAIIVVTVLMSFAVLPIAPGVIVADWNIGLLFVLGMSSLGVYSIVLAGWASANKYSLLGALRASAQMLSYEVFMGLSLMGVVLLAGSFDLARIVEAQRNIWFVVPQFLGFILFLIAGVAETRRLPFDLPEAESELIAGFHSEYSGMKFGMFFVGEYLGVILISALITILFFGGWLGPVLPPIVWFLAKTFVFICFFVLLRAALPRLRFDQLMALGWKVMLPLALANLLITGAVALSTRHERGVGQVEKPVFVAQRGFAAVGQPSSAAAGLLPGAVVRQCCVVGQLVPMRADLPTNAVIGLTTRRRMPTCAIRQHSRRAEAQRQPRTAAPQRFQTLAVQAAWPVLSEHPAIPGSTGQEACATKTFHPDSRAAGPNNKPVTRSTFQLAGGSACSV